MKTKILPIILFAFLIISFATLPRNPLQNDDASLYALAIKNAIVHNQWLAQFVTPGDLSSFLDKPPLGIWLLAWIPQIVGINELTIHIPNVLYFCLLLLLLYLALSHLASKRIALYSTLVASTSLALVAYSRAPKLDILTTLFILAAHLSLYAYLKRGKPLSLYSFTIFLALGFLVKTGFGIIMPGLTFTALFLFNLPARKKLWNFIFSSHFLINAGLFIIIAGGVLGIQSLALKDCWPAYLKSILIQSKYNVGYLGLGFNYSIIGLLLIAIFPWTAFFLSSLSLKFRRILTLHPFCNLWFWSNFLFLLLFYRQTDFRTFTVLVPPLSILAGHRLISLQLFAKRKITETAWNIFFLLVFSTALILLIIKPYNAQGIDISAAIAPASLFVISLLFLTIYSWKPNFSKLTATFIMICISYVILFYNTFPLASAFNPDLKWPELIKEHRANGYAFYIYRPPDRKLFYSPDLFYVDFMAGPADRYFWDRQTLTKNLETTKTLVLSDTESWDKLNFKGGKIIARDSYSSLILR